VPQRESIAARWGTGWLKEAAGVLSSRSQQRVACVRSVFERGVPISPFLGATVTLSRPSVLRPSRHEGFTGGQRVLHEGNVLGPIIVHHFFMLTILGEACQIPSCYSCIWSCNGHDVFMYACRFTARVLSVLKPNCLSLTYMPTSRRRAASPPPRGAGTSRRSSRSASAGCVAPPRAANQRRL
jgi:hypothetical protein